MTFGGAEPHDAQPLAQSGQQQQQQQQRASYDAELKRFLSLLPSPLDTPQTDQHAQAKAPSYAEFTTLSEKHAEGALYEITVDVLPEPARAQLMYLLLLAGLEIIDFHIVMGCLAVTVRFRGTPKQLVGELSDDDVKADVADTDKDTDDNAEAKPKERFFQIEVDVSESAWNEAWQLTAMERIAPLRLAEHEWDNVGLLLEAPYPRENARKIMLTIEVSKTVLDEAISDDQVGVIVSYHPAIFKSWKRINLAKTGGNPESFKQDLMIRCATKGISVYCPHTSLDNVAGGINDWLATCFGDKSMVTALTPSKLPPSEAAKSTDGAEGGGRLVSLEEPISIQEAVQRIKKHLGLDKGTLSSSKHSVRTIAICAGSGADVLLPFCNGIGPHFRAADPEPAFDNRAKHNSPDLLFTGEMTHHAVIQATNSGAAVVLCEHTNTERGYLSAILQRRLSDMLKADSSGTDVEVIVSATDRDPFQIV
ncbi:hypothetical protein RI367_003065 [Sorochytrium milnesiophthora]